MNSVPESDQKLDRDLREVLGQVLSLRDGLHCYKHGCACTRDQLCAHHAAVYRHLDQARKCLHRAIDKIEIED